MTGVVHCRPRMGLRRRREAGEAMTLRLTARLLAKASTLALLRQPLEQQAQTARWPQMRARLVLRSVCHLVGSPLGPASPSALVQQQQRAAQRQRERQVPRSPSPARRTPTAALQQRFCQLPWHLARGQLRQPQMGGWMRLPSPLLPPLGQAACPAQIYQGFRKQVQAARLGMLSLDQPALPLQGSHSLRYGVLWK